jgi:hypothetical protein
MWWLFLSVPFDGVNLSYPLLRIYYRKMAYESVSPKANKLITRATLYMVKLPKNPFLYLANNTGKYP